MQDMKLQLDQVLQRKVAKPSMELYDPNNPNAFPTSQLIQAIIDLITKEDYSGQVCVCACVCVHACVCVYVVCICGVSMYVYVRTYVRTPAVTAHFGIGALLYDTFDAGSKTCSRKTPLCERKITNL